MHSVNHLIFLLPVLKVATEVIELLLSLYFCIVWYILQQVSLEIVLNTVFVPVCSATAQWQNMSTDVGVFQFMCQVVS